MSTATAKRVISLGREFLDTVRQRSSLRTEAPTDRLHTGAKHASDLERAAGMSSVPAAIAHAFSTAQIRLQSLGILVPCFRFFDFVENDHGLARATFRLAS